MLMRRIYNTIYEYIFITFYKSWKTDIPEWNAALLYPIMAILNLIVLLSLLRLTKYLNDIFDLRIFALVLYASLILLNYFAFIKNNKFKEFRKNFVELEKGEQKRKYRIGIAISILGYVIPIIVIILMAKF